MFCLECNNKTKVIESRVTEQNITIRRHRCKSCGLIFYTEEEYVDYSDIKEEWLDTIKRVRLGND